MTSTGPRRAWYALPIAVAVVGLGFAAAQLMRIPGVVSDMQRVVMPGEATIELPRGDSNIYFESRSTVDGVGYVYTGEGSVRCVVKGTDGAEAALSSPTGSIEYSFGGRQGQLLFEVDATAPGAHVLRCEGDDDKAFVVAIGTGEAVAVFCDAALAIALGGFGGLLGALVIWRLRRRAKHPVHVPRADALLP